MIDYLIIFIVGFIVGVYMTQKYKPNRTDLDVKTCVDYLSRQGFYVKLHRKAEEE